jgi:cyanophycinase-like exopeptidase
MTRLLAIMGSGETAPTMIKPHRAIFDRLGPPPVPAVLLDTPYGFQMNADDISARAVDYFKASVGRAVEPLDLRRVQDSDPVRREQALSRLAQAQWVFAGPGSPTYALRQWAGTDVADLLSDMLEHGGAVVFASAAALTLGRYTVPVYEIYKVGLDPEWAPGLNLLHVAGGSLASSEIAVIPHYDNAEGGNHDTRFCYLGEHRLAQLEQQMSDDGWVLGVDEHTACVFDFDARSVTVTGNGTVTVRRRGRSSVVPSGTSMSMDELVDLAFGGPAAPSLPDATSATPESRPPTALHAEVRQAEDVFTAALSSGDPSSGVRAALALDDTLEAWSGDTTQSDAADRGRAALRRMIVSLGALASTGARDPRDVVGGYVDALIAERSEARAARRYDDADRVREALNKLGIELRDTADGTEWDFLEELED